MKVDVFRRVRVKSLSAAEQAELEALIKARDDARAAAGKATADLRKFRDAHKRVYRFERVLFATIEGDGLGEPKVQYRNGKVSLLRAASMAMRDRFTAALHGGAA